MHHTLYTLTKHIPHTTYKTCYTWNIYYIHSPNIYYTATDGLHRTHTLDCIHSSDIEYILHTPYQCAQHTHLHNRLILHIQNTWDTSVIHSKDKQQTYIQNIQYFIRVQVIYTEHMLWKQHTIDTSTTHTRNIRTTYTLTQCINSTHHNRNTHTLTHIHTTHPSKAVYENTFTLNTTKECGLL